MGLSCNDRSCLLCTLAVEMSSSGGDPPNNHRRRVKNDNQRQEPGDQGKELLSHRYPVACPPVISPFPYFRHHTRFLLSFFISSFHRVFLVLVTVSLVAPPSQAVIATLILYYLLNTPRHFNTANKAESRPQTRDPCQSK